jgi:hypothetical protein
VIPVNEGVTILMGKGSAADAAGKPQDFFIESAAVPGKARP